jgi:hypothetical protein
MVSMIRLPRRRLKGGVVAYGVEELCWLALFDGRGGWGLTGWAEKKMSLWERMAPQTMAANWADVSMRLG